MTDRSNKRRPLVTKVAIGATMALFAATSAGGHDAYAAPVQAVAPAGQVTITGTVLDSSGEPLVGASVKVVNSGIGISTNIDGEFSLKVPANCTVEVSFVGCISQRLKVTPANTNFTVTLQDDAAALDEVVVVGYGQQKKVNLTGSVSSINVGTIAETRPLTNISQALAGLAAGVNVTQANNQPGNNDATIRVRGQGTISSAGNGPLVIIDGAEAPISSVDPQDVETMSILKDAASASIYGSRAANGVILITTKKGKAGTLKVNYTGNVVFNSVRKTITPVSNYADYMELVNEGYANAQQNLPFSQARIDEWRSNPTSLIHPNSDWIDETFKPTTATNHMVSMSGGTEKIRFYGSFGYSDNPGIIDNTGYQKYSGRVSVDADIRPWLTLGINASGYVGDMDVAGAAGIVDQIFTYGYITTPGMVFHTSDGRVGDMANPEDNSQCRGNNPWARTMSASGGQRTNSLNARFYGTIRPYKGLSISASYNYQFNDTKYRRKPRWVRYYDFSNDSYSEPTSQTSVSNSDSRWYRYYNDLIARYENKWDRLGFNVMVGLSNELYRQESFSASKLDLLDLSLWSISAATGDASASGSSTEWSMRSYFGRINLNWDEKYLFEFNLRKDGSSRFRPGHRYGWFPSGSIGWRIDQEAFAQSLNEKLQLSNLKLRASYGALGNNGIGNYDAQSLYSSSSYVLNHTVAPGLAVGSIANSLITWEKTKIFDIGLDFGFLNNRFSGTFDFFNKITSNILIDLPAPSVHGTASLPKQNAAKVRNRGVELTLGWNDRVNEFTYNIGFNMSYITNEVLKFKGKDDAGRSLSGTNVIWEGYPINCQYLYEYDRIIQTAEDMAYVEEMIANAPTNDNGKQVNPFGSLGYIGNKPSYGDLLYKDLNGDGVVNADDRRIFKCTPTPKFYYGINLGAEWRGIDFSMLMQGQAGAERYVRQQAYTDNSVNWGSQINKEIADGAWREGRTDATYPRLVRADNNSANVQSSNFWLQKLDFLKIRNIQLGYTLPAKWTQKAFIERVRVYGSLENFFTFTSFKGFDPELAGMGYPTMKQATVGINLTF